MKLAKEIKLSAAPVYSNLEDAYECVCEAEDLLSGANDAVYNIEKQIEQLNKDLEFARQDQRDREHNLGLIRGVYRSMGGDPLADVLQWEIDHPEML